ncbi:MAG: hypothetical protein OIF55_17085 [Amphritea sp.]|nr:hypothetical protein [Amphritea sp.]
MTRSLITLLLFVSFSSGVQAAPQLQLCRDLSQAGKLSEALQHCQPLAEQGDGEASFWLSNIHTLGINGQAPDLDKALAELTRAAEANYGPACFNLASLYDRGELFERSPRTAFHWYLRGAEAGHVPSQAQTGNAYLKGVGTEIDFDQARIWLTKAAEADDQGAQITLAILVRATEPQLSMFWYQKAAQQGNSFAFHELAEIYADGLLGQQQDLPKAILYARKSVRLGRSASQFLLDQLLLRQHQESKVPVKPVPQAVTAVESVAPQSQAPQSQTPQQPQIKTAPTTNVRVTEPSQPGLRDEAWLMAQPPERYVAQLIQLSRETAVRQFIKDNALQGKVDYFRARTGAGNVYVVLYAETAADRSSALKLTERLPEAISKGVWLRRFGAIQSSFVPVE